jgi:hypothetical protein
MANRKLFMIAALVGLMATSAMASAFRSADVVYLPVAGKLAGANNSFFRTDVWISNVTNQRVVVDVAFAPQGGNNENVTDPANTRRLPVLEPFQRREIVDIMGQVFGQADTAPATVGQLIFFACREGGNCTACDDNAADCLPITVQARIYTTDAAAATFGQLIPGIPWFNFVSPRSITEQLHQVFITGIRQTADYRTNIGIVNASQFSSAVVTARLFQADGQQFGPTATVSLPPLGFSQQSVASLFPGFAGNGAWVLLEQQPITIGSDPGFLAYGSLVDNKSNDPTYLEAQYIPVLDFGCVYAAKPIKRLVRRD